MSRWRHHARAVIAEALRLGLVANETPAQLIARIDAAYPFGERAHHPYKIWLSERRKALDLLAPLGEAWRYRKCPACGAAPQRPCVSLHERDEVAAARLVAKDAKADGRADLVLTILRDHAVHDARLGITNNEGLPLFAARGASK